jgi:hypothetical protein
MLNKCARISKNSNLASLRTLLLMLSGPGANKVLDLYIGSTIEAKRSIKAKYIALKKLKFPCCSVFKTNPTHKPILRYYIFFEQTTPDFTSMVDKPVVIIINEIIEINEKNMLAFLV